MRRKLSIVTSTLMLLACTFFLWMFFAAATLEHTADLGWITAAPGRDARTVAFDFAARWRHGMSGNSPIYMPGFFAVAMASWFWGINKTLRRMVVEGFTILGIAALLASLLAPYAAPLILSALVAQEGVIVTQSSATGTWISVTQGIYSLLTWCSFIIAVRWSIRLRSPKPLLIPVALNLILAFIRPWTVADFTSQWFRQSLDGEPVAVFSFLLVPTLSTFIAWVELRRHGMKTARLPDSDETKATNDRSSLDRSAIRR